MKKRKPLTEEEKKFSVDRFGITVLDDFGDLIEYKENRYERLKNSLEGLTAVGDGRAILSVGNVVFARIQ